MTRMARNFVAWLLEDVNDVSAEAGTPRDEQMKEYERQGFLKHYDAMHGNNYYVIEGSAVLQAFGDSNDRTS